MNESRFLQTLCYQALERAIGELNAAQQAMYTDRDGNYPELSKVIDECIEKLRNEM